MMFSPLLFLIGGMGFLPNNTLPPRKDTIPVLDYKLYDGILVENFDSTVTDENRFAWDNQVYVPGNSFEYQYYYEDLQGNRFVFEELKGASELPYRERRAAWRLVPLDSLTERSIPSIIMEVQQGLQPFDRIPEYSQTVIKYQYPQLDGNQNFNESTGIIENAHNIWIHPPRSKLCMILEINPFPFIKRPFKIGNKWDWSLKIGGGWGDPRWITWEESIKNEYTYEITALKTIPSAWGDISCYEITSTAQSPLGQTHLVALYHPNYGFVRLDYLNIDGTKMVFELTSMQRAETNRSN